MARTVLTIAALLGLTAVVVAQSDPIATRRNIMKGVGAATRTGSQLAKGDIPFDLAKAQDVLKIYASAAENFPNHFPETSKTGGETTAGPAIWEKPAEFRAQFDEWGAEIRKASADTKDADSFRTAFGTLTKACGSCHTTFRIKT